VARGGLTPARVNDREEVEVGYVVAAPRWGKGLGTEIARASVRVAFAELDLTEVVAFLAHHEPRLAARHGEGRPATRGRVRARRPSHVLFRVRRTPW